MRIQDPLYIGTALVKGGDVSFSSVHFLTENVKSPLSVPSFQEINRSCEFFMINMFQT